MSGHGLAVGDDDRDEFGREEPVDRLLESLLPASVRR